MRLVHWIGLFLVSFAVVSTSNGLFVQSASAQIVFPSRTVILPVQKDPGRQDLGKIKKIKKSLFAKPKKGARGTQKRKPKKFKKITLDSFRTFVSKNSKKKGARGKSKKAKALLKTLKKGGKITVQKAAWAGQGKAKKGSRGGKSGPKKIKTELEIEAYLAELNKLEKKANALGYSLLEGPNEIPFSAFVSDSKKLAKQAKALTRKNWGEIKPFSMPKTPLFASLNIKGKKGARGGKRKSFIRMLGSKNPFKVGKRKKQERAIKILEKEYKDQIKYGSNRTAAVGFDYSFYTKIDTAGAKAKTGLSGTLHVFGKKFEVLKVVGDMSGKVKGKHTTAKLTAYINGKEKVIFTHDSKKRSGARGRSKKDGFSKASREQYQDGVSHRIEFVLAFIPVTVEVGAAFSAGVEYKVSVKSTSVSAEITPFLNADGFARFAIDVVVAQAGVEGRITLLDLELRIMGEGGVSVKGDSEPYAYAYFVGDLALEALSGALSVFLNVDLLVTSKKFKHGLWSWKGFVKEWRLFELRKEVRLELASDELKQAAKKNKGPDKSLTENACDEGELKAMGTKVCQVLKLPLGKDCTKAKCTRYRFARQGGKKGLIVVRSKTRKKFRKRIWECKEGEQRSRAKNTRFDGLRTVDWCLFWSGKDGRKLKHANKCPGNSCPYWLDGTRAGGGVFKLPGKPEKAPKRFGRSVGLWQSKKKSKKTVWVIENSTSKGWVKLKNKATGKYLHNQNGRLELGKIKSTWKSAMWNTVNAGSTGFVRIQNGWKRDRFIHNEYGGMEVTELGNSSWPSAQWSLVVVPGSLNVRLKNRKKGTYLSAK